MVAADKVSAIRQKAELLAGQDFGESGDLLVEMAAQRACAHCNRTDIPVEMEQAVAQLAVSMAQGEQVKSLQRGDTAITYVAEEPLAGLAPWCRLGTVKGDDT